MAASGAMSACTPNTPSIDVPDRTSVPAIVMFQVHSFAAPPVVVPVVVVELLPVVDVDELPVVVVDELPVVVVVVEP